MAVLLGFPGRSAGDLNASRHLHVLSSCLARAKESKTESHTTQHMSVFATDVQNSFRCRGNNPDLGHQRLWRWRAMGSAVGAGCLPEGMSMAAGLRVCKRPGQPFCHAVCKRVRALCDYPRCRAFCEDCSTLHRGSQRTFVTEGP